MKITTLGRTGLDVSVAALGAGGHSRLGLRRGASEAEAADLVRAALDRGITLVDTAPAYGTEHIVGAAIKGRRDNLVVSSKAKPIQPGADNDSLDFISANDIRQSVETSLKQLGTDYIDILHLHGVRLPQYAYCLNELQPELQQLCKEGKIRFIGITEGFGVDAEHAVMQHAIADRVWDVLMLGYNFVNPSAAQYVLPKAKEKKLGVMAMYAVRGALARKETLTALIEKLVGKNEISADAIAGNDPSAFLLEKGVATSLTEAAYRFCRHTAGIDVVMTGTGNLQHLEQNIAAIAGAPLPQHVLVRLAEIFGRVRSATGDPE